MMRCAAFSLLLVVLVNAAPSENPTQPPNLFSREAIARSISPPPQTCTANETFLIQSFEDLHANKDKLDCVYAHGSAPKRVPLGPYYGEVLNVLSMPSFTALIESLWRGKFTSYSRCNDEKGFFTTYNLIGGRFQIPALVSIGSNYMQLAPNEHDDRKPALLIDYTQDFTEALRAMNNIYPFNTLLDVVRVVGRQADGGVIWAITTYDTLDLTDLEIGEALPALPSDSEDFSAPVPNLFRYVSQSVTPVAARVPLDPPFAIQTGLEAWDDLVTTLRRTLGLYVRPTRLRGNSRVTPALDRVVSSVSTLLSLEPSLENRGQLASSEALTQYTQSFLDKVATAASNHTPTAPPLTRAPTTPTSAPPETLTPS